MHLGDVYQKSTFIFFNSSCIEMSGEKKVSETHKALFSTNIF